MKRFSNISIILKEYLTVISIFFCFRFILFLAELDKIPSQSNYPLAEVKTTLGVPDDYMFRYSIPVIDKLASEGKPFFVTFMTASDHGPWCVPEYYHSKQKNLKDKVIEYADWSLKKFVRMASARPPWLSMPRKSSKSLKIQMSSADKSMFILPSWAFSINPM